jgi:DNA ligase N terminus
VSHHLQYPGIQPLFHCTSQAWEEIADESKRLAITQLLCNAMRAVLASTPGDLLPALYLCSGRVAASHTGIELGVGDSILIKVGPSARMKHCDLGRRSVSLPCCVYGDDNACV